MLPLSHSDWVAEAPNLPSEALVFLIRQIGNGDPMIYGYLFQQLGRRIAPLARRATRGLDRETARELVLKVEIDILELIVSERPSRKRDFLEIAFAPAVEGRSVDLIRIHLNSPLRHLSEIMADPVDEDGDEIDRPIEMAPDHRSSPEEIVIALQDESRRKEWFRKACNSVKNPLHREVVLLHHVEGMSVPEIAQKLPARPAQVKYWLTAGLKVMRKALGVEPEGEKQ
jgi:hypothetical protein